MLCTDGVQYTVKLHSLFCRISNVIPFKVQSDCHNDKEQVIKQMYCFMAVTLMYQLLYLCCRMGKAGE
jgi:hypothetical protein